MFAQCLGGAIGPHNQPGLVQTTRDVGGSNNFTDGLSITFL